MSSFRVDLERQVTIVERATVLVEADSQGEAEKGAIGAAMQVNASTLAVNWKEDAERAEIGDAVAVKVALASFSDQDAIAAE